MSQAEGQDEFPGLAFGIKELDRRPKFSSTNSRQDFPSLGAPSGGPEGPKPTGVWGKGAGHLAGEFIYLLLCNKTAVSCTVCSEYEWEYLAHST